MSLRERAAAAFGDALERAGTHDELAELRDVVEEARGHLDEPMRVAIVGHIKAGKSTMLNALLGEELAATGAEELTFNVNWLRHGAEPGLVVHFKDGREPEERTLADLEQLTARREENRDLLGSIRYVELRHPNAMLNTFDLIDTPGLKSFFGTDSLNTLEFLGLSADEVEAATRDESSRADALLCLFSRSLASADQSVVSDFQGPLLGNATPINAIGVLTKVDTYWNPREPDHDPLEEGRKVARDIEREPGANRVFYAVMPVCGLLAFGAQTLEPDEIETLRELAAVPPETIATRLRYADRFATREYDDLPVPAVARDALVRRRLGQYGIWLATTLLRDGVSEDELRAELLRRSGVAALRELLLAHFGNRSFLIKLQTGLRKARAETWSAARRLEGDPALAAGGAGKSLEGLEAGEPAFEEFALLRRYYEDHEALGLVDGEAEELLSVTGEHGTALGPRLGLGERALPAEMVPVAEQRLGHWRGRMNGFGADTRTVGTARVMAGAYERMLYHARAARRHLELDD